VRLSFYGKDLRFVEDMFDPPKNNDALKKSMATIMEMPLKRDMDHGKKMVPIIEGRAW